MKLNRIHGQGLAFRRVYLLFHLCSPQGTQALGGQDLSPRSVVTMQRGSSDPQLTPQIPWSCFGSVLGVSGLAGQGTRVWGPPIRKPGKGDKFRVTRNRAANCHCFLTHLAAVRALTLFSFCQLSHGAHTSLPQ